MFLDEAKIYIRSGDGGNGCISFRREKFIEFGGPDGGNGGRGGDIIFRASRHMNSLINFRYHQHFKAVKGTNGSGRNRTGKCADPIIIDVPIGTEIISEAGQFLIKDMNKEGEEFLLAEGGKGGVGNSHFKSSVNQAPRKATLGGTGEERWLWLKLKLISDVGLVGLPNAGKSTFISQVSAARPKIADYPFTTLAPQLGVVYLDNKDFVIADLPGLIKNAHLGVGLGIKFLKHIERCKIIIHLIDIQSQDILENYHTIRNELESYSELLKDKEEIIVLNKTDLLGEELSKKVAEELKAHLKREIFTISSVKRDNITPLLRECLRRLNK
jgi:GTP-binding protein